jgi:hypothetical protein
MSIMAVGIRHEEWYPVPEFLPTATHLVAMDSDLIERYNQTRAAFEAVLKEVREAEEAQERLIYDGLTWREHNAIVQRRFRAEQAEAQRRDRQQRQWG